MDSRFFPIHIRLILIREEVKHPGEDRYGGVWDYIPLNKINSLSLCETENDLLCLSIKLPDDAHLEFLYRSSVKDELNKLITRFKDIYLSDQNQ